MLIGSRWPANTPLLDPLCGSGTIAIEAALLARRIAPALAGADRRPRPFRFLEWPSHDGAAFEREVERAHDAVLASSPVPLLASDRNAGAIHAATANAERAGVANDVAFDVRDLGSVVPPAAPGWLATNPPYGVRVGGCVESREVAVRLARLARTSFARWVIVALSSDTGLARRLPGSEEALRTRNGGIPVRLLVRWPGGVTASGSAP
jgi:putative N6-adenine-specific DNA methylase